MSADPAVPQREPWFAATLSLFIAGTGQIYAGRTSRGSTMLVVSGILFVVGVGLFYAPSGSVSMALPCVAGFLVLTTFSIVDAYRCVARSNSRDFEIRRHDSKDPWLAVFLSRIVPGLGHFYLGRIPPGIVLLLGFMVLGGLSAASKGPLPLIAISLWYGAGCYLAYTNSPVTRETSRGRIRWIASLVALGFLFQQVTVTGLRGSVVQAFRMPSASMEPTLRTGEHFLCSKLRSYAPHRGDIIVFKFPEDTTKDFVKRVIGMPRDTLAIHDKTVWVNGVALSEPYVQHTDPNSRPGRSDYRDNFGPFVLGDGEYFVLGDNRESSNDSRYWGPLRRSLIEGRAYKIYFPLNRAGRMD